MSIGPIYIIMPPPSNLLLLITIITNAALQYVSGVTIKDIQFKNIKGTATTPVAVLLRCGVPCQGLVLQDVNLRYKGQGTVSAKCENAKAKYVGVQLPKPCP